MSHLANLTKDHGNPRGRKEIQDIPMIVTNTIDISIRVIRVIKVIKVTLITLSLV